MLLCPYDGSAIHSYAHDMDIGYCALGHRVTGSALMLQHHHDAIIRRGVLALYEGQTRGSAIQELRDAVEASFITQAEARQVALGMFPAARKLAEAQKIVAENQA